MLDYKGLCPTNVTNPKAAAAYNATLQWYIINLCTPVHEVPQFPHNFLAAAPAAEAHNPKLYIAELPNTSRQHMPEYVNGNGPSRSGPCHDTPCFAACERVYLAPQLISSKYSNY